MPAHSNCTTLEVGYPNLQADLASRLTTAFCRQQGPIHWWHIHPVHTGPKFRRNRCHQLSSAVPQNIVCSWHQARSILEELCFRINEAGAAGAYLYIFSSRFNNSRRSCIKPFWFDSRSPKCATRSGETPHQQSEHGSRPTTYDV